MGSNYYLRGIRQQVHGVGAGDNTDTGDASMEEGESAESEPPEDDPQVSAGSSRDRPIGAEVILNDSTTQLNNALAREHWRDASILQHLMKDLLDLSYQNSYENLEGRRRFTEQLINRFEEMTNDARRNGHLDVVATYEGHSRQWRQIPTG